MRFTLSLAIILLLAIVQASYQEEFAKDYKGPNPEGKPGTPPAPPPLKKPPDDSKTPKTDTGLSSTAEDWVAEHNKFRQKGKNIPDLLWDAGIYKIVKSFVTGLTKKPQCETQPFAGMKLQRYGMNAATVTSDLQQSKIVAAILQTWYNENRFYDPETKNCTNDDLDVCFHFTQLMWKSTNYFACRLDTCQNGKRRVAVCFYIRPGNCNDRDYTKSAEDSPCGPYLPPASWSSF